MKSAVHSLFAVVLLSALAACTPPDDAQTTTTATPPPAAPATEQAVEPPAPAASQLPTVAALDDAQRAETVLAASACNLESIDGQSFSGTAVALAVPSAVKATGWLKAERAGAAVENATLRIETEDKSSVWAVPVQLAIAREDLASTSAESAATPGFDLAFDAGALPSGRYHLYLAYRVDGVLYGCDNGRHVTQL
jgi:hypothetical protein